MLARMWNSIKSYLKFCSFAFSEDYQQKGWYKRLSTIYIRADKLVSIILGTTLSALVIFYLYPHRDLVLNNKRWSAIVILSTFSLFLLYLIGAIKRFHERVVNEMEARRKSQLKELCLQYYSDLLDANKRMLTVEKFGRLSGRADELAKQLLFNEKEPLPARLLQWWSNDLENDINERFGSDAFKGIFGSLDRYNPVPLEPDKQETFIRERQQEILKLIGGQYLQSYDIAEKTKPKEVAGEKRALADHFYQ
jgi:hypothetical protein